MKEKPNYQLLWEDKCPVCGVVWSMNHNYSFSPREYYCKRCNFRISETLYREIKNLGNAAEMKEKLRKKWK